MRIVEGLARSPAQKKPKKGYIGQNSRWGMLVYNIQAPRADWFMRSHGEGSVLGSSIPVLIHYPSCDQSYRWCR